jgi:hypothetical protein
MPTPLKVVVKNVVYTTPILNGEMDAVAQEIINQRQEIENIKVNLKEHVQQLQNLNNQLLAMYIQQTGQFP